MLLLVVVGASAGWWFGGGYERWQDGRSLRGLCGGALDTGEVRELLDGAGRLRGHEEAPNGALVDCWVSAPDRFGILSVRIGWEVPMTRDVLDGYRRSRPSRAAGTPLVPLGAGWAGVVSALDDGTARLALSLPCTGKESARQLVVELNADPTRSRTGPADDFASADQRARLGRIATRIARRADTLWGCAAPLGGAVTEVPGRTAVATADRGRADGTCAGVDGPVREGPADPTVPIEDCAVLRPGRPDTEVLRLSAYYPPFAAEARYREGLAPTKTEPGVRGDAAWATAKCPTGQAFFLAVRLERMDTPAADALAGFARRSAERHGCEAPRLP
ncbi:hypothetical protein [Kitasatospora sp. NPDC088134]|uniref:hypothetical protein n=1 Tax=Kitasatospora sp. NPDC088134 TaxID=3364071 RepID=UPI0038124F4D